MKKYKIMVGIFGIEPFTVFLIQKLRTKNFSITALWDKDISAVTTMAKELSIPFYSADYNEIIMRKDIDLILVFSAPHFLIPIATRAVSIGKHVICNNCAGIEKEDMNRMVEAGLYYPQLLSLPFNPLRFNDVYSSLRDHIDDIGNPRYIRVTLTCQSFITDPQPIDSRYDWKCETSMGGGALNIYGSHIIDIVGYIMKGVVPVRVWGSLLRQDGIHCDSMASFELVLENDLHVFVTISAYLESNVQNMEFLVVGNLGYLVVRGPSLFRCIYAEKQETLLTSKTGKQSIDNSAAELKICLTNLINSLDDIFIYNEDQKKITYQATHNFANFTNMGHTSAVISAIRMADKTKRIQLVDYNL